MSTSAVSSKKNTLHVKVHVRLKKGVLDPQGITVHQALKTIGYQGVEDVRVGKLIELDFHGKTKAVVQKEVEEMAEKLLTNPIIEEFSYEIEGP